MIFKRALADEPLEHRGFCLLDLYEERVVVVTPEHERNPRSGSDAPDADDLSCQVDESIALQQATSIARQGAAIGTHRPMNHVLDLLGFQIIEQLLDRHDEWRIALDPKLPVHLAGELGQGLQPVLRLSSGYLSLEVRHDIATSVVTPTCHDARHVEPLIPDIEVSLTGELSHRLAVGPDRSGD